LYWLLKLITTARAANLEISQPKRAKMESKNEKVDDTKSASPEQFY